MCVAPTLPEADRTLKLSAPPSRSSSSSFEEGEAAPISHTRNPLLLRVGTLAYIVRTPP